MPKEPPMAVKVLVPIVLFGAFLALLPRKEGPESLLSATTPNPPPTALIDPFSFGGMADGSGGLATKTTYGAGAPGPFEGASEIYSQLTPEKLAQRQRLASDEVLLVPDPTGRDKTQPYLASAYLDLNGTVLAGPGIPARRETNPAQPRLQHE